MESILVALIGGAVTLVGVRGNAHTPVRHRSNGNAATEGDAPTHVAAQLWLSSAGGRVALADVRSGLPNKT